MKRIQNVKICGEWTATLSMYRLSKAYQNPDVLCSRFELKYLNAFRPVTGAKCSDPEFEEFLQTQLLAYVLTRTIVRTDVMFLHPLTQIFLHYKRAKFQWLIWFSILFHVILFDLNLKLKNIYW